MFSRRKHVSDRQIISHLWGELPAHSEAEVWSHLETCGQCRTRSEKLHSVIGELQDAYGKQYAAALPSEDEARRLLRSRLTEGQSQQDHSTFEAGRTGWSKVVFSVAAVTACLAIGISIGRGVQENIRRSEIAPSLPDSRLTPGATLELTRQAVCGEANVKNKPVPVVLQQKVFQEYGISAAPPQAYEVDYLVTPALGGAEDLRNLWPQSFSPDWNARVKDDLEDRLREMVCKGDLDLAQAQREIASNWIGAYKRYFHTDRPLPAR